MTRSPICNLEVAYESIEHRSNREEHRAACHARPRLAGTDRLSGIRHVVRRKTGISLHPRKTNEGEYHLSRIRTSRHGSRRSEDGEGAALLISLAPLRR